MTRILDVMQEFATLPGAVVGRGPGHPLGASASAAPRIDAFLRRHPVLKADRGYVEFLNVYAGASIERDDPALIVDILGFSEASTDMEAIDGEEVDENGFLMFAEAVYHQRTAGGGSDAVSHAFAFDVTGARASGVHRALISTEAMTPAYAREFNDFASWLEDLVARDGWYDPPGPPTMPHGII